MNPLLKIRELGQQLWLDNLSRNLLSDDTLANLIEEDGISGVTTNPAIFYKAISCEESYQNSLATLSGSLTAEERYEQLIIPDVQAACDLLLPTFANSNGLSGYVSLEVSPTLATDVMATVNAGRRLFAAVGRRNLLIKVPATTEGFIACSELLANGINVNLTLLFSLRHIENAAKAHIEGLKELQRRDASKLKQAFSVASLFLSRVDTLVDRELVQISAESAVNTTSLAGKTAVSMAKLAYQRYQDIFSQGEFSALAEQGAKPQHLLWASTSNKNPDYNELLYVEPIIGSDTINTLPDKTLAATREHGQIESPTLDQEIDAAQEQFDKLESVGIDINQLATQLQSDGLAQFQQAYSGLLELTKPPAVAIPPEETESSTPDNG